MLNKPVAISITTDLMNIIINRSDAGIYVCKDLIDAFNYLMQGTDINLIAWDLDETVAPLIQRLGKERCIELQKTGKTIYKDYKVFYIAGKLFSISTINEFKPRNIYHLEQYYPNDNKPLDLQATLVLVNNLLNALKVMNMQSNKLSSPVAIYEDCMLRYIDLPTLRSSNINKEAAEYAYRCSGKLWIEAFKIGHFEQAYDYDISGAFPTFAKQMIDTTNAKWICSKKYQANATYGFCKGYVIIKNNVKVSPIVYEYITVDGERELSNRVGTWETYLTKAEIDFINKWNIGHFEIENGWWCYCENSNKRPLENIANRLLAYKKHDNPLVRQLAKRMSVGGLYGKFGEEHKSSFGKYFNPVWFAYISVLARLEVAEWIYSNNVVDHVLHISVDGVLLDCPIEECNKDYKIVMNK